MEYGKYNKSSLIVLIGFLLFFLGTSLPFQPEFLVMLSSLIVGLIIMFLSFKNRSVLGGFLLGIYATTSFVLGFFLMTIVIDINLYFSTGTNQIPSLSILINLVSAYGFGIFFMEIAYAGTGLFFGLLGYIFENALPHVIEKKQPYLYRDYWSNIHKFNKNKRKESPYLDRRLSFRRISRQTLREKIEATIAEPKPDIIFNINLSQKNNSKTNRGTVSDLFSGQIIDDNVVNPYDLASKYKPKVLKVAGLSQTPKGIKSQAFERLLSKFLDWFLNSRWFWVFYFSISTLLITAVYVNSHSSYIPTISAIAVSIISLFLIWRWRVASKQLFEKRPDERVLIFAVFIILALSSGIYFLQINNPPTNPATWSITWVILAIAMFLFSLVLGLSYLLIHREFEMVNTYFYYNNQFKTKSRRFSSYSDPNDEPFWIKEERVETYWVFRFMYFWRYELTMDPHSDWERIEVWVDAKTGLLKWIVSDYHYRELWYKVEGNLPVLYASFLMNFHTPIPIINSKIASSISNSFNKPVKNLLATSLYGEQNEILKDLKDFFEIYSKIWMKLHPKDWIINFGLTERTAEFASGLPWTYWRYVFGVLEKNFYIKGNIGNSQYQPQNRNKNN